ncbi:hypothetical protein CP533_2845 [Ophiocordyceps camponoti-saundersi (nom. inval.)]|nr:hypothetical protein CP533_2845 [Ophiocordyceps camponoti-saundersi (nom. inval.)]
MCYKTVITGPISLVYQGINLFRGNDAKIHFRPIGSRPDEDWWYPIAEGYVLKGPGIISMKDVVRHLEDGEEALAKSGLGWLPPTIQTRMMPSHSYRCNYLGQDETPSFESAGDRMTRKLAQVEVEPTTVQQGIQRVGRGIVESLATAGRFHWRKAHGSGQSGDALSPDGEGWSSNRWMRAGRSGELKLIANVEPFGAGELDSQNGWRSDDTWRRPSLLDDGNDFQDRERGRNSVSDLYDDMPSGLHRAGKMHRLRKTWRRKPVRG